MKKMTWRSLSIAALLPLGSYAQIPSHPWVVPPPQLEAHAYFTNLRTGDVVDSPFVVKFGMSYWGIAPADHDIPHTGHHHLLINQPLPIPVDSPIPFSDRYRHFGKGQMEVVLDLPPGQHSLRLLLANHQHVPHFVFSKELKITVRQRNAGTITTDHGKTPRLEFLNIASQEVLKPPFRLQFHASGLNVAHSASKLNGTGYFQVRFESLGKRPQITQIPFPNGVTEAWFYPPPGTYRVQLQFMTNPNNVLHPARSEVKVITVVER